MENIVAMILPNIYTIDPSHTSKESRLVVALKTKFGAVKLCSDVGRSTWTPGRLLAPAARATPMAGPGAAALVAEYTGCSPHSIIRGSR